MNLGRSGSNTVPLTALPLLGSHPTSKRTGEWKGGAEKPTEPMLLDSVNPILIRSSEGKEFSSTWGHRGMSASLRKRPSHGLRAPVSRVGKRKEGPRRWKDRLEQMHRGMRRPGPIREVLSRECARQGRSRQAVGFTGPVVRAPVFQLRHCWGWLSAFCNADACGEKHRDCLADLSPGVWRQCGGQPGREGSRAAEREAFRFRQL